MKPSLRKSFSALSDAAAAVLALALTAAAPMTASACAVCYGEPDSPASKGLTWAIVALGAIVVCVLGGVVAFFVHASRHIQVQAEAVAPEAAAAGALAVKS